MLKSINLTHERNELLKLPETLGDAPVIIRDQGLPIMVAISYDEYISMLETMDILSDSEFKEQLIAGIKEDQEGKRVSFSSAMEELEW